MIYRIYSDMPTFKNLEFKQGLNLILADKSPGATERHIGPGLLVHDSHIFDGVDERRVAKALQLGESAARELGFQYIVTMNSDAVPRDLPNNFDLNTFILPVRFTDATEKGGLFGIRF